jgi:hypothetical protein
MISGQKSGSGSGNGSESGSGSGSGSNRVEVDMWSATSLAAAQAADPELASIYRLCQTYKTVPPNEAIQSESETTKAYGALWPLLTLRNDVLYRRWIGRRGQTECLKLLPPVVLRRELIARAHTGITGGHLGTKKTQHQVQRRAYWRGWRGDVQRFCRQCTACSSYHRGSPPKHGQLQSTTVGAPLERVGIDLTGPHPGLNAETSLFLPT